MKLSFNGISLDAGLFNSAHAALGRRASLNYCAPSYEVALVEAEGGVIYVNEVAHTIEAGTLLCLRPGDECRMPLPYRAYYVRFADASGDLLSRIDGWERVCYIKDPAQVLSLISGVADATEKKDVFRAMSDLMALVAIVAHEQQKAACLSGSTRQKTRDALRAGLEYMEQHYREKCTLKEIAEDAGRSPIYFHDVFGEAMGVTPYEYIAQLRLNEAKRLLSLTTKEPDKIAEECGFCSQSYFNFVFKKAMGMTPLHYRRALATKYISTEPAEKA